MNNDHLTPEQLAKQIIANSTALVEAELKLKAISQRQETLLRQAGMSSTISRHKERIFWLFLGTGFAALSYASYLYFSF